MSDEQLYKVEHMPTNGYLETLGYALGEKEDIRRFYEADGKKVSVTQILVSRITGRDADDRERLEALLKGTTMKADTMRTGEREPGIARR